MNPTPRSPSTDMDRTVLDLRALPEYTEVDVVSTELSLASCAAEDQREGPQRGWRLFAKRSFDRVAAFCLLVLLSPLLAALALAVRWRLGSPVLFVQVRPGFEERPLSIVKFRTMLPEHDEQGRPIALEDRITPFGRTLRSLSLDELPQLWTILTGELSLVGPRPLLTKFLPHYTPEERRRHSVLPGLTGLAQIQGRQHLTWERKLELDARYVDEWSLWLDATILVRTILYVLLRRDATNLCTSAGPPAFRTTLTAELA
jgi:sugar transferase EpsL